MKNFIIAILALGFFTQLFAEPPQSKEDIINEAIAKGAVLVRCQSGKCYTDQSHTYVGDSDQDGAYLVFPDKGMAETVQKQMQPAVRKHTTL